MLAWFCERDYAWAKRPLMSKISRLAAEKPHRGVLRMGAPELGGISMGAGEAEPPASCFKQSFSKTNHCFYGSVLLYCPYQDTLLLSWNDPTGASPEITR